MADVCGPFTLEQLDQFGSLDSLAFSLDSEVWESANTCIFDVSASTTASATTTANGYRERFGDASVTGNASTQSQAIRVRLDGASVSTSTSVALDAIRLRFSSASITTDSEAIGLGGVEYSGSGEAICQSLAWSRAYLVRSASASIYATSSVVCRGIRIGDNWSNVPEGDNTWTTTSSSSNTWTTAAQGNNTWQLNA